MRPGGRVANIGVHGKPATLHLEELWIKDVTITTGLVETFTIPTLLDLIGAGRIDPEGFTSHRFGLGDAMGAYDTFARAAETDAMKVLMTPLSMTFAPGQGSGRMRQLESDGRATRPPVVRRWP